MAKHFRDLLWYLVRKLYLITRLFDGCTGFFVFIASLKALFFYWDWTAVIFVAAWTLPRLSFCGLICSSFLSSREMITHYCTSSKGWINKIKRYCSNSIISSGEIIYHIITKFKLCFENAFVKYFCWKYSS